MQKIQIATQERQRVHELRSGLKGILDREIHPISLRLLGAKESEREKRNRLTWISALSAVR